MKFILLGLGMLVPVAGWAQGVTLARAAELGCHRIERLRDLGRISDDYVNKAQAVRIELLASGPGKFKFTAFQAPGADGSANRIELILDENGKAIGAHNESKGADSISPVWPDKDAITLIENGLHYILDNGPSKSEVAPFYNHMTEAVLVPIAEAGETRARIQFKNAQTAQILDVTLKLDGTFVSAVVRSP